MRQPFVFRFQHRSEYGMVSVVGCGDCAGSYLTLLWTPTHARSQPKTSQYPPIRQLSGSPSQPSYWTLRCSPQLARYPVRTGSDLVRRRNFHLQNCRRIRCHSNRIPFGIPFRRPWSFSPLWRSAIWHGALADGNLRHIDIELSARGLKCTVTDQWYGSEESDRVESKSVNERKNHCRHADNARQAEHAG